MMVLSWWEQFIVTAMISFLSVLHSKLNNPVEAAALTAALDFLQQLMGGKLSVVAPTHPAQPTA